MGNHSGLVNRRQKTVVAAVDIVEAEIGRRPHHLGHHGLGAANFIENDDCPRGPPAGRQNRAASQCIVTGRFVGKNPHLRIGYGLIVFNKCEKRGVFRRENIPQPAPLHFCIIQIQLATGDLIDQRNMPVGIKDNKSLLN